MVDKRKKMSFLYLTKFSVMHIPFSDQTFNKVKVQLLGVLLKIIHPFPNNGQVTISHHSSLFPCCTMNANYLKATFFK